MVADSPLRQRERARDVSDAATPFRLQKHVALPRREWACALHQRFDRERGLDDGLACGTAPDRTGKLVIGGILQEISRGSTVDRSTHEAWARERCQDDRAAGR